MAWRRVDRDAEQSMTDGYRLAALKLYGLARHDRQWLLDKLDKTARAKLATLLSDLARTGLAPHDAARASAQASSGDGQRADGKDVQEEWVSKLDAESVRLIARVLGDEPDWVCAIALESHAWSWRDAVVRELGAVKGRAVMRASAVAGRVKPSVRRAILCSLSERVNEARTHEGAAFAHTLDQLTNEPIETPSSRREAFRSMVKRWIR
jgi:hypothetical protein